MTTCWNALCEFIAEPLREARKEQQRHWREHGGTLDRQTPVMLISVAVISLASWTVIFSRAL